MDGAGLSFDEHGAARHDRAALRISDALEAALAGCPRDRAGVRLHGVTGLAPLLAPGGPLRLAVAALGPAAKPVRAILFDKTPGANWALGWHQDRTVAVRERHDIVGYGPWSTKAGVQHVEPPFDVIERMVTLRIHLDDVPADNAPLLIAPGSHRLGRIAEADIADAVARCGTAGLHRSPRRRLGLCHAGPARLRRVERLRALSGPAGRLRGSRAGRAVGMGGRVTRGRGLRLARYDAILRA